MVASDGGGVVDDGDGDEFVLPIADDGLIFLKLCNVIVLVKVWTFLQCSHMPALCITHWRISFILVYRTEKA
jgi:hypothetical protein